MSTTTQIQGLHNPNLHQAPLQCLDLSRPSEESQVAVQRAISTAHQIASQVLLQNNNSFHKRLQQLQTVRHLTHLNEQQEKVYAILLELLAYEPKTLYLNHRLTHLPYSILVSPSAGTTLLFKSRQHADQVPVAREKKLKNAVHLPKDSQKPAFAALESTSHFQHVSTAIANESRLMRQMACSAILPSIITGEYVSKGRLEPQHHLIMPKYNKTDVLTLIHDTDMELHPVDELRFMQTVVSGLLAIHSKNFVHGDIKTENIFAHAGANGLEFALGDLEFTHQVGPKNAPRLYAYGTPALTAPEVFLAGPIDEKAAEIWAAGKTCFEFFFPEAVGDYDAFVDHLYKQNKISQIRPAHPKIVSQLQTRAQKFHGICEKEIAQLSRIPSFESMMKINWLRMIQHMMDFDPKKRPTAEELVRSLQPSPASPSAPPAPHNLLPVAPPTQLPSITLTEALKRPLNIWQKLLIISAVSDGLAAMHKQGLYHGEIHQNNTVISPRPDGKSDVGLLKIQRNQPNASLLRSYNSPETTSPEAYKSGITPQAADVWACGKLFLEILYGPELSKEYDDFMRKNAQALLQGDINTCYVAEIVLTSMITRVTEALTWEAKALSQTAHSVEANRELLLKRALQNLAIRMLTTHSAWQPTMEHVVSELHDLLRQYNQ